MIFIDTGAFIARHRPSDQFHKEALRGWRELAAREQLQAIGSKWAKSGSSAVLAVPSAVIPAERNYLLNPLHLAFAQIEIGEPQTFITDLRLIKE